MSHHTVPVANQEPKLEMENEEKIRLEARRRLEEQLKQYRVQRHKERVSGCCCYLVEAHALFEAAVSAEASVSLKFLNCDFTILCFNQFQQNKNC